MSIIGLRISLDAALSFARARKHFAKALQRFGDATRRSATDRSDAVRWLYMRVPWLIPAGTVRRLMPKCHGRLCRRCRRRSRSRRRRRTR